MTAHASTYRTYWVIWGVLLAFTLAMIAVEGANLPRILTLVVLTGAMFAKATLITAWFMHLKYERTALILVVVLGTLITVTFLAGLLAVDGAYMLELSQ